MDRPFDEHGGERNGDGGEGIDGDEAETSEGEGIHREVDY